MSNEEDKHRQSVRLKGFDYAYRGFFFVTMCTHDKKPTLGKIINYESQLSDIGRVVEKCWREIPNHFSNVCLDEWVIMPNHLHEIVVIRFPLPREKQGTTCRAPTNAETIYENWGSIEGLLKASDFDYLKLSKIIQKDFKQGFPYLSGPKIFNYWCYILTLYCNINLKNAEYIEIAPDTHVTKCSVILGVITEEEAENLSKDQISARWREILSETGINPIDMHAPLWFWSRNGFIYSCCNTQAALD
jgi:hypothetical protein